MMEHIWEIIMATQGTCGDTSTPRDLACDMPRTVSKRFSCVLNCFPRELETVNNYRRHFFRESVTRLFA